MTITIDPKLLVNGKKNTAAWMSDWNRPVFGDPRHSGSGWRCVWRARR